MEIELLLSLAGLALVDSTSIGTLFIPVWLLMSTAHVSVNRILFYLLTIALFYFVIGLLLMTGAATALSVLNDIVPARVGLWMQLAIGIVLFAVSFRFDSKRQGSSHRVERWRERTTAATSSLKWLMGLAFVAGLAEVATMLPYLGAIAILTGADLSRTDVLFLLAAYCLVMILPACLLLVIRLISDAWLQPLLRKLNSWVANNGESAIGWMLGIAGFLVAGDAASRLFSIDKIG